MIKELYRQQAEMHKNWEAYNESGDLISQVEAYKNRFGCFPESVHADKIYRNRKSLEYCKEKGIRLSGPALGRPKTIEGKEGAKLKRQVRQDERDRIAIEGKGNGTMDKRLFFFPLFYLITTGFFASNVFDDAVID